MPSNKTTDGEDKNDYGNYSNSRISKIKCLHSSNEMIESIRKINI
jgi:hypothetical protein